MSFDKDYPNRKDWRKPYHDSRRFDTSCRNHGSCSWCVQNRTYSTKKWAWLANQSLHDYYAESDADHA